MHLEEQFKSANPKNRVKESFAQIVKENKPTSLHEIKSGDIFELQSASVRVKAQAKEVEKVGD
jgi:exonuclease VII large subunit